MKQKRDRYEMHKYWGKKPSSNLRELIEKYTEIGDTVLDPFSGYGVFGCEAYILNRNVILNDLNPIANFINVQLLEEEVDLKLLQKQWKKIKTEFTQFNNYWYKATVEGQEVQFTTVLRNKNDVPLKAKYKKPGSKKSYEIEIDRREALMYLEFEESQTIKEWFPKKFLLENSRISAKKDMTLEDLFTKRTLACHAKLLQLIEDNSSGSEQNLLKVAFTANLANCSKLVPPIKSRGEMAPGAWMTGFYIGETYLENNVLDYFENRLTKVIKGKTDYLLELAKNKIPYLKNKHKLFPTYKILLNDAKSLELSDNSVDYIFTDPPYGDAVPYFEQSIIWNSWLKYSPDYINEIVVSNSTERNKGKSAYEEEIFLAFKEIRRVLKPNKYFTLTYHSLSGLEWKAITNACIKNGFELVDYKWLVQKTFTPRQINRNQSIKGDVLVTLRKLETFTIPDIKPDQEVIELFTTKIEQWLDEDSLDTNEIFLRVMKMVFTEKIIIGDVNLLMILTQRFKFLDNKKWIKYDQLELC